MAQDLTVNIKTTSDVPQAMDKAKSATVSFSKQIEDVQKKFSTGIKDIFLGFTAPMVIFQSILSSISQSMEEARRMAQEGVDLIAKGETKFATTDETKFANLMKAKDALEKEKAQAEAGKKELATWYYTKTEEGKKLAAQKAGELVGGVNLAGDPIELAGGYENLLKKFMESKEGKDYAKLLAEQGEKEKKPGTFKGPEGFGTVVGVGANPVLEKMTRQNEIMEEIKIILQEQSIQNRGGSVPSPFTERVPITLQKIGAV